VAGPIARKALDYYLLGKRPGEKARPASVPAPAPATEAAPTAPQE
jgi:penicillin-binding protein 2